MRKHRWNRGIVRIGGLMLAAAIGSGMVGWGVSNRPGFFGPRLASEAWRQRPRAPVRRLDVQVSLTAGGRIESAVRALIKCELESLSSGAGGGGRSSSGGGSATIIELIPDGSSVRLGDVLCRLDSSEFEEMVRRQEIQVEQARADRRRAELDLQKAGLALHEYEEGLRLQRHQELQGQIALAEADLERQQERVAWAERMRGLGYVSAGQLQAERLQLLRTEEALRGLWVNDRNFRSLVEPNALLTLRNSVGAARATLDYQAARLERQEERLAHYRRQVEFCTVRAPHDGIAVYANGDDDDEQIELGLRVRQRQDLFYLPDLTRMEVQAMLHETVVERVRPGMPARVRVEAFSGQELPGRVVSVSPVPMPRRRRRDPDIKNYLARVALDEVPAGLRPGMTAAVEILTARKADALVIPTEAVAIEDGRDVCYVAGPRGPERRPVAVEPGGLDLLEVTDGLAEGEEVLLDPRAAGAGAAEGR